MGLVWLPYALFAEPSLYIKNWNKNSVIFLVLKIQFFILLALMPMADYFETLFGEQDAIISDALNHASIIDGIRLCKAQRFRYANNDMNDLETQLKAAQHARFKVIATDGVFSMDGINSESACHLRFSGTIWRHGDGR